MKKYLNNKDGMALYMVLIIMTILMIFASSLALFAYDSLLSVRWMSNEKRAYYLARAGVEAASYAYQVASTESENYSTSSDFGSMDEFTQIVAAARDGATTKNADGTYTAPVKSNTIYAYYTAADGEGLYKGIEFKTTGNTDDPACLGSFVVEIGKGIDLRQERSTENDTYAEASYDVVAFKCTATCGASSSNISQSSRRTSVVYGYIAEAESATRLKLYDDYGVFNNSSFTAEEKTYIDVDTGKTYDTSGEDKTLIGIINNINNFLKGWVKDVIMDMTDFEDTKEVQPYSKTVGGDLILETPAKSKTIKAPGTVIPLKDEDGNVYDDGIVDHLYVVMAGKNIFVNAGIDATPEKTGFTVVGLYGDQIVIDGDITMEVYITNPDAIASKNPITMGIAASRFRIGTVILGSSTSSGSCKDPLSASQGGIQVDGEKIDGVNKVFFNGNVNLKVYTQGATTQTYRVFSAGDVVYFYGGYKAADYSESTDGETATDANGTKGIDLLKFFIDASLADLEGFEQNSVTKGKLEQIKEFYYGADSSYQSYVTDDTVLMRKIIVKETTDSYLVDGDIKNIPTIIQPSEGAGAEIVWGRPRHGDVWNNFEKVS